MGWLAHVVGFFVAKVCVVVDDNGSADNPLKVASISELYLIWSHTMS